jgi:hypothetical protein
MSVARHPLSRLFLALSAFLALAGPAHAVDRYVKDALDSPEIGIALGDLMYSMDFYGADPKLPRNSNQLKDADLAPLDPALLVIQFPKANITKQGDTWRLVLTEHGQWGYAAVKRESDRRIIAQADIETMLKDYKDSRRSWIFIKEPIQLANGAIVLTRGEFYPLETSGGAGIIVDRGLQITRSKYEDIKRLKGLPEGVQQSQDKFLVPLGNEYVGMIDYLDLRKMSDIYSEPADAAGGLFEFGLSPAQKRARQALRSNAKFLATKTGERLECNQVRQFQSDATEKREWSAKIGIDLGKFINGLTASFGDLGLTAAADASFSGEIQDKTTLTATEQALSFDYDIHLLEQAGSLDWVLIGNSQNCKKNPADEANWIGDGDRFFRVTLPGVAGSLIDQSMFERLAGLFPDIEWKKDTGKLRLSCRKRDYEALIGFLKDELELDDRMARVVLQQISIVKKHGFEGC